MESFVQLCSTFFLAVGALSLLRLIIHTLNKTLKPRLFPDHGLPPGSLGWPLIGETPDFIRANRAGEAERFIGDRMAKYNSHVFKTSLFGEAYVVLHGPAGHKLLFSNENKLVKTWWPSSVKKLFNSSLVNLAGDEGRTMRRLLMTFFNPDALKNFFHIMDSVTRRHIRTYWEGKQVVKVYPTMKVYTLELACLLFAGIEDPSKISKIGAQFDDFLKGIIGFSINIPGTRFYWSMKAADAIRKELMLVIRHRRAALDKKEGLPGQDLLSHLLVTADANGKLLTETQIVDNILLLLFAGHDTTRAATTLVFKYLAQLPQVYQKVFQEQMDIAKSREETRELLTWEDVQKMRYTWNVVSEVLRLSPPISGGFREALVDFSYAGYKIPKGWKILWSSASTQKDPSIFPEAENFDPSRFEGAGPTPYSYAPFGGGPRMCLGHEFARLQILIFLHNIVMKFKWEMAIPGESFGYDPILAPSQGLPVRLQPHH